MQYYTNKLVQENKTQVYSLVNFKAIINIGFISIKKIYNLLYFCLVNQQNIVI